MSINPIKSSTRFILLACCLGLIMSCGSRENSSQREILTIENKALTNRLYFTGIIRPLKTIVVPSPADGVIIERFFQYGAEVKAKQTLFKISSTKFLTDYKTALLQYIKAKSEFNNGEAQLSEAKFLHSNLLISDDEFKTKTTNFYSAQLGLLQAKDALENLLKQMNLPNTDFYKLTIADVDKITNALHLQTNYEDLQIYAPVAGIILAAYKTDDEIKKVNKGDAVKQGDVLAVIGDMNGFTVRVKVDEMTVNQLQVGQQVKITGIAFKEYTLAGQVDRIDHQGESSSGGLPTFSVDIVIPKLTDAQKKIIHIGMSAKIEIAFAENPQISIPIAALLEKNGETQVLLWNEKSKTEVPHKVVTGKTSSDAVSIVSGLKLGDKIVLPH